MINQRLSSFGPVLLYEMYQKIIRHGERIPKLTPEEIVEKTWGTIKGIDPKILREIIEDEEYCVY